MTFQVVYPSANVHSPYVSSSNLITVTSGVFLSQVPIPSSGVPDYAGSAINGVLLIHRTQTKDLQPTDDSAFVAFQGRTKPVLQSGIFGAYSIAIDYAIPPPWAPLWYTGVDASTPAAECVERMLIGLKGYNPSGSGQGIPGTRNGTTLNTLGNRGGSYCTCLQIQDERTPNSSRVFFGALYGVVIPYLAGDDTGWKRVKATFTEFGVNS